MLPAALMHYFCFSHKPYINYAAPHLPCCKSLFAIFDVRDVKEDLVRHAQVLASQSLRQMTSGGTSQVNGRSTLPITYRSEANASGANNVLPTTTTEIEADDGPTNERKERFPLVRFRNRSADELLAGEESCAALGTSRSAVEILFHDSSRAGEDRALLITEDDDNSPFADDDATTTTHGSALIRR